MNSDILSIIIFFVILGVASLARKVQEQKEEERRKHAQKQHKAEDLPEASRRMIYGSPNVPVARPARPVSMPPPEQDERVETELVDMLRRMAEPAGPPPVRPPAPPRPAARPVPAQPVAQQPARRSAPPAAPPQLKRQMQQVRLKEPVPRTPVRRPEPAAARPKQPHPEAARRRSHSLGGILRNLDDVRRGIIVREILGPPKGLL